jgi:outer membrane protein, heavy metal efflux system
VSIRLPLFNRNQGNIQAAQARAEASGIRKGALESVIRQEVQVALEGLQIAQTNFLLFRDSIMNQSEKQLAVLQASYRAGEFSFLDLINEQKRALEIRKSYINSAREYFMALAELEFVTATDLPGGKQ